MKPACIIPTYNNLKMLKTLVKQLKGHFVYIIDNGLQKDTIKYLKDIKDKNIKVIFHNKNYGIAKSWNDGLREAIKDNCTHFAIFNEV